MRRLNKEQEKAVQYRDIEPWNMNVGEGKFNKKVSEQPLDIQLHSPTQGSTIYKSPQLLNHCDTMTHND